MFCEKCGNQMPDDSKFCFNCGAQITDAEAVSTADTTAEAVTETADEDMSAIDQQDATEQSAPQHVPVQSAQPAQQYIRTEAPQAPKTTPVQPPAQPMQNQYYQQPAAPQKPEKVAPLKTWKFVGMFILAGIPVVGLIMVLAWSFSNAFNKNTKSFGRAILILWIIGLIISIVGVIANWAVIMSIIEYLNSGFTISY